MLPKEQAYFANSFPHSEIGMRAVAEKFHLIETVRASLEGIFISYPSRLVMFPHEGKVEALHLLVKVFTHS